MSCLVEEDGWTEVGGSYANLVTGEVVEKGDEMFDSHDDGVEVWRCTNCGEEGNDFEFCAEEGLEWLGRWEGCKAPGCDGGQVCNGAELVDCEKCDARGGRVVPAPEPCVWCGNVPKCDDCEHRREAAG